MLSAQIENLASAPSFPGHTIPGSSVITRTFPTFLGLAAVYSFPGFRAVAASYVLRDFPNDPATVIAGKPDTGLNAWSMAHYH